MKRFLAAAAVVFPALLAPLAPACSSNSPPAQGSNGDANPDSQDMTPVEIGDALASDASYTDELPMGTGLPDVVSPPTVPIACTAAADCPLAGEVCGFPVNGGCSAAGVCVFSEPPTDGNGVIQTACGCAGQTVLYVEDGYAAMPVASALPCGQGDASVDGAIDARATGPVDAASGSFDAASDSVDAASDSAAAQGCLQAGGTVTTASCCSSAGAFPDRCTIGACSCAPSSSVPTVVCQCPTGTCFSSTLATCVQS